MHSYRNILIGVLLFAIIFAFSPAIAQSEPRVQIFQGTLPEGSADERASQFFDMEGMVTGDTIHVYIETAEEIDPVLSLYDFADDSQTVAIEAENDDLDKAQLSFEIDFDSDYFIQVSSLTGLASDYTIAISLNDDTIFDGSATASGEPFAIFAEDFSDGTSEAVETFGDTSSEEATDVPDDDTADPEPTDEAQSDTEATDTPVPADTPEPDATEEVDEGDETSNTTDDTSESDTDDTSATANRVVQIFEEDISNPAFVYPIPIGTDTISPGDVIYGYLEIIEGDIEINVTVTDLDAPLEDLYDLNDTGITDVIGLYADETASSDQPVTFEVPVETDLPYFVELAVMPTTNAGRYRLVLGLNEPDVLTGNAEEVGNPVLDLGPTIGEVNMGIYLLQISNVDQTSENFTIEAVMNATWRDECVPCLATDEFGNVVSVDPVFSDKGVEGLIETGAITWPEFTIANQQDVRKIENRALSWNVVTETFWYEERFKVDLQIPIFDFTAFPFDQQLFPIRIQSFGYNNENLTFVPWEEKTGIGEALGEEEWIILEDMVEVRNGTDNRTNFSQYSFELKMGRHLTYYIYRIFVPIGLILLLSWFAFFLKDYDTRLDAASGTLLAFIAFNFTIGDDLPRIAYLTFIDMVMIIGFVVTSLTVIINIFMKRYQDRTPELIKRLDSAFVWIYPVVYVIAFTTIAIIFI